MRRMTYFVMALALVLGFTQCKKEQLVEPQGEQVRITLDVNKGNNNGSKAGVDPPHVTFVNGDQILVASGGQYVGILTHNGNNFSGDITDPVVGEPLYFYFLGNKQGELENGATTCTVNISDQTGYPSLPVISMGVSIDRAHQNAIVNYSSEVHSYEAQLHNKASLMKFKVTTDSEANICITGMNNLVMVNFNPETEGTEDGFTYGQVDGGLIKMKGQAGTGEKTYWAIVLPQATVTEGEAYSDDNAYTGTRPAIEGGIVSNTYYDSGIAMNVNTHVWNGNLAALDGTEEAGFATATDGMTIYGALAVNSVIVSIADGANVTLQNATIDGQGFSSYDYAGLTLLGSANITLVGTSTMSGGVEKAGIYAPVGGTLTISGDGTINATGGEYAAGIGSNYLGSSGNIVITNGSATINATGGYAGAGIGSGYKAASECGNIEITDSFTGTVNATGHYGSPGIGSGNRSSCGSITISGGTINATGEDGGAVGNGAPGIGSGIDGSCGAITINESVILVTAVKGNSAPCCIGKGSSASCGTINIGGTEYPSGAMPNQTDGLTFVYPVPAPVITLETPLTLEALSDGTIVVNNPKDGMKYTLNGGAKQTMSGNTEINVSLGDKVQFYGNGTSIASYQGTMITGGMADVKVYGNIMSLVDEENFATATTLSETYTFYRLFYHYEHLTDASGLLLPATTLASANSCYAEMFSNCDNLVAGPSELPATTLSPRCYQAMFLYCTSLTVAPILPATTLEGYCYFQMFRFCTSLTEAPVLPAPVLTGNCYREMFSSCSSLNSITCLATSGINSSNSTFNWVNGVASSGTFTKASVANVSTDAGGSDSTWPMSIRGIPEGWTVNDQ